VTQRRLPDTRSTPRLLDNTHRRLTIGISLGISVVGFETLGVSTAMPSAARELHGLSLYGWAFTALLLGNLLGIVFASGDADARGPHRAYIVAFIAFVGGLSSGTAATTMPILISTRFVGGLGAGALTLLNWTLIGRIYPESIRSRMLAVASSAWVIPGLIGPAASGWVADHLSWRWVFAAPILPTALVAVLVLPVARRLGPPEEVAAPPTGEHFWDSTGRSRGVAAILLTTGAAVTLSALASSHWLVLAVGVGFGSTLVVLGGRTLFPPGTWRAEKGLPAVVATYALLFAAFTGVESFLPLALNELRHLSSTWAGIILTCGTTSWAMGSWMQAHNPHRWAEPTWRMAATALYGGGILGMIALTFEDIPTQYSYAAWTLSALGMGLSFSSVTEATFRMVGEHRVGLASGATQLAGTLLAALATGVVGATIEGQHSGPAGFRIGFVLCAALTALAFFAGRAIPAMTNDATP
jgi:MFS family permease